MSVNINLVKDKAPHLVDLVKATTINLEKRGLDPKRYKAAVVITLDHSGSAQDLYSDGTIQQVGDLGFAAGLVFDDDGEVPVSLFHSRVEDCGSVELGNCQGYVNRFSARSQWGMTDYVGALKWIVDQAGYGKVNLDGSKRSFGFGKSSSSDLSVKAIADYPTYALFVTDGNPNRGTEDAIRSYLTQMSQLPIFVQFVGVGHARFDFLESLDELDGRFIDNAGFFDAKDVGHDQDRMLEKMLEEFPHYYRKAVSQGLVKQPVAA